MPFNLSNVKKITLPVGSTTKDAKAISLGSGASETTIWKGTWLYTINIGDYVSSVKWSDDNSTWTTITSNTTVEIDSGKTLYIQAVSYNTTDAQYTYTPSNFDITRTEANEGGSVTVSQTRTLNSYTITWKWMDTYSTWTTTTQTYNYGDTPSRTSPSTVTSGNNRKVFASWNSLATVTGARTITATYTQQYYVAINRIRCTCSSSDGWYNSGSTITFTANSNCAFNSTGTQTTYTPTINSGGTYTGSADYVNVTLNGTHCSGNKSGWQSYGTTITWTASTGYCFDTSNTTTTTTSAVPGTNSCSANYVLRYTLTISVTNSGYGSYSVSRTSSPYAGAATGALSSGSTIYYGDVLSGSSSAAASRYTDWDCTAGDLTICTGSWNGGDTTSPSITVTAKNSATANLYRRKWYGSYYGDWVQLNSNFGTGATSSYTDTGLEFNTTYNYHVARNQNRYRYDRSASSSNYTGTNGVTGNVTASFSFSEGGANLEQNWIAGNPSTVDIATGSRNAYTITWVLDNGSANETTSVYYGDTPSHGNPSKEADTYYTYSFTGWSPSITTCTGNKTYTAQYSSSNRLYTVTISPGDYVNSVAVSLDRSNWTNGLNGNSVSIQRTYNQTVYWRVNSRETNSYYVYKYNGDVVGNDISGSIGSAGNQSYTVNLTRTHRMPTINDFSVWTTSEDSGDDDWIEYRNTVYIKNNFDSTVYIKNVRATSGYNNTGTVLVSGGSSYTTLSAGSTMTVEGNWSDYSGCAYVRFLVTFNSTDTSLSKNF